jgi:hypothetical protein
VYHQALQAFAQSVCGLPEVRCVTYTQLADFMDGLSQSTLAAYQSGDFPHANYPGVAVAAAFTQAPPAISIKVDAANTLTTSLIGENKGSYGNGNFTWLVDGKNVGEGESLSAERLPKDHIASLTVLYRAPNRDEALRATQGVGVRVDGGVQLVPLHAELTRHLLR